jgi:hypothetical protein
MDDISKRLRDAADNCIKSYEAWAQGKKDIGARESLQEAVHELRKVSARLEIEVAASEREDITQRHIPIPSHRAARHRHGGESSGNLPDFITEGGSNGNDDDSIGNSVEGSESRPRSVPSQGRMQQQQRHRRPMRRPQENGE